MTTATRGKLSEDEVYEIICKYREAKKAGDDELAYTIGKQIPLVWQLAQVGKKAVGVKGLEEMGFDLSEAVNHFGRGWLNE